MYRMQYHEKILHNTGGFPLAFYHVDPSFSRYRMTMHWHEEVEFIRVISGKLDLYPGNMEYSLSAGDFCSIGSGVIHGGEPQDCVYECIVFDLRALSPTASACAIALRSILNECVFLKRAEIGNIPGLEESLTQLFSCSNSMEGGVLRLLACMFDSLSRLASAIDYSSIPDTREYGVRKSQQIKPALEYIERNYSQHITLEQLASVSGFSPKYFCRYFRSFAHRSPIDYLNYYRIERGAEFLLRGNENVAEIAARCGFSDSSAFIKQFKRFKGTTPKQYQRHLLEENSV